MKIEGRELWRTPLVTFKRTPDTGDTLRSIEVHTHGMVMGLLRKSIDYGA